MLLRIKFFKHQLRKKISRKNKIKPDAISFNNNTAVAMLSMKISQQILSVYRNDDHYYYSYKYISLKDILCVDDDGYKRK